MPNIMINYKIWHNKKRKKNMFPLLDRWSQYFGAVHNIAGDFKKISKI